MSGRLKGSASFGTTVPTGPYRNVKIAFEQEFWLDETTHEDVLAALAAKADEAIAKLRSAPEVRTG